jgi:hypothetical protein
MAEGRRTRGFLALVKNLFLASLLYATIYGIITIARNPNVATKGRLGIPAFLDKTGPAELIKTTKAGIKVKFASSPTTVTMNPHANVFNSPALRRRRRRHVSWQSRRRRTAWRRAHFRRAERHDRFAGGQKRSGKVAVASAAVL